VVSSSQGYRRQSLTRAIWRVLASVIRIPSS
jgi:hypothetical protein